MRRTITLMGLGLVAGIVFLTSQQRSQAPDLVVSWIPDEVSLSPRRAAEGPVGLGGTLVGGRLFYGRSRPEGRLAARADIARGRPQWIGFGFVSFHHSGVNPRNGLPGVSGWPGELAQVEFFAGYNDEMERALQSGEIAPPQQVNPGSHLFAYLHRFAQGETWEELLPEGAALPGGTGRLHLDPHPTSAGHGFVSLQAHPTAPSIRFAFVTRPVRWHQEAESGEIVLREDGVVRVFHGQTGQLLREFPLSERDLQEMRDILARREAQEAEDR